MLIIIDNIDSFTYNLVQYFGELGHRARVLRHKEVEIDDIESLNPSHIVISPGPDSPNEAGISLAVVKHFAGRVPILGVCLGHQCIAQHYGARIINAPQVMHGKTSLIYHQQHSLFKGLASPFTATRYHSLVVAAESLPATLMVTAQTEDSVIMAIAHNTLPLYGVQFHPESVLTESGHQLLANFLSV